MTWTDTDTDNDKTTANSNRWVDIDIEYNNVLGAYEHWVDSASFIWELHSRSDFLFLVFLK